jgi:hypothetical protein
MRSKPEERMTAIDTDTVLATAVQGEKYDEVVSQSGRILSTPRRRWQECMRCHAYCRITVQILILQNQGGIS